VVVVGGFQGVSFRKDITTLGRGGSDVTAVALASSLEAEVCEIYSDVDAFSRPTRTWSELQEGWMSFRTRKCRRWGKPEHASCTRDPSNSQRSGTPLSTPGARSSLRGPERSSRTLKAESDPESLALRPKRSCLVHAHESDGEGLQSIQRLLDFCSRRDSQQAGRISPQSIWRSIRQPDHPGEGELHVGSVLTTCACNSSRN